LSQRMISASEIANEGINGFTNHITFSKK